MTHKTTIKVHKTYILVVFVYESFTQVNKSQTRQHYIRRTFKLIYQTSLMCFDFLFLSLG